MDKNTFNMIWEVQDLIRADPEYRQLLEEQETLNAKFLKQLETMNDAQRNAVLDYCGLLIEMHIKTLAYSVHLNQ